MIKKYSWKEMAKKFGQSHCGKRRYDSQGAHGTVNEKEKIRCGAFSHIQAQQYRKGKNEELYTYFFSLDRAIRMK